MTDPLGELGDRYAFNGKLLGLLLGDFEPDDWRHRVNESNHAQWLTGHLANTRRWMLRELGQTVAEDTWEGFFGAGGKISAESDAVDPATLQAAFEAAGQDVVSTLGALTTADAAKALPKPFPDGSTTVGGMLNFLHFHEAYHIGQVGLIRRALGKPGLI